MGQSLPAGYVHRLRLQPDGAILAAGYFPRVGAAPVNALARLLDPNVLHVRANALSLRTAAWPVPTHDVLHLTLDPEGTPQQVEVLDALGRVLLTQPVGQPELSLPVAALPRGHYLLRVRYARAAAVVRRIVLN